jgi:hypothetical protein
MFSGVLFVWVLCCGGAWEGALVRGVTESPSMSERVLFSCCDEVDGVGDKVVGTCELEAFCPVAGLYAGVGGVYVCCREVDVDVDGVNNPCARPWLKSLIADPGMIGAGPRLPGP